ncbi:hypothetical protein M5K25_003488 [Dendrobium thyrsiflorum]|uniref:Uncharacterized protein n=1 Tax=Dendrobium thyrsiflorum TaxID=117978 RepID=A0ABD0VRK6_DENTH
MQCKIYSTTQKRNTESRALIRFRDLSVQNIYSNLHPPTPPLQLAVKVTLSRLHVHYFGLACFNLDCFSLDCFVLASCQDEFFVTRWMELDHQIQRHGSARRIDSCFASRPTGSEATALVQGDDTLFRLSSKAKEHIFARISLELADTVKQKMQTYHSQACCRFEEPNSFTHQSTILRELQALIPTNVVDHERNGSGRRDTKPRNQHKLKVFKKFLESSITNLHIVVTTALVQGDDTLFRLSSKAKEHIFARISLELADIVKQKMQTYHSQACCRFEEPNSFTHQRTGDIVCSHDIAAAKKKNRINAFTSVKANKPKPVATARPRVTALSSPRYVIVTDFFFNPRKSGLPTSFNSFPSLISSNCAPSSSPILAYALFADSTPQALERPNVCDTITGTTKTATPPATIKGFSDPNLTIPSTILPRSKSREELENPRASS